MTSEWPILDYDMVGVAGFEPTTSSSRTKRATKLRHTPEVLGQRTEADRPATEFGRVSLGRSVTSVSSVASGGQAKRIGAYGDVPGPPRRAARRHRAGAGPWPGCWGGRSWSPARRAPGRQTCPPWVWPGEDKRDPVGGHRVEDPQVWRVRDAEREVGGRVGRPATSS